MSARQIADQMIQRSRDIRVLIENEDRRLIRAALTDLTLEYAKNVADHLAKMLEQQWALPARKLRTARDVRTMWRSVIRYVKATYDDHPITERHLSVVLAAYHWHVYETYESIFGQPFLSEHRRQLAFAAQGHTRSVVLEVLSQY